VKRTFLGLLALAAACGGASSSAPTSSAPVAGAPSHAAPVFPPGWPYAAANVQTSGAKGVVTSDAALATKVSVDTLASGGNAVDAAVALSFALAVVYPTAGNIGGGGFMVARVGGNTRALDFRETAPAAATHDMYLDASGKPNGESRTGWRASGVPGSIAGLWEAYSALGSKKKTWAELVAPAIKLADEGFVVDKPFAEGIKQAADRLAKFPASAALFLPNGAPPAVGSTWKDPDLAAVLRRIAEKGPDGFYKGPTAELVASEMKKNGGLITAADLEAYRAKWRTPIEFDYRGHHVASMPPPSSGGLTIAMIAHILEPYDLAKMGWQSPPALHLEFETMRRAFAARSAKLGDPDFVKNPVDELMSPAWAQSQRATIRPDHASPSAELWPSLAPASGGGPHTTHFAIVDADGNAVGVTTTINWWYGSGVTIPGAGFVMNNEMDDFAAVPGTANGFGLVQGESNAVAPGKRMLSSMAPTIVLAPDGRVRLVLGAAGGPTIITAVFEELSNVVDFGLDVGDATVAPRFHQQDFPDLVMMEPHGITDDTKRALEAMGHSFKERGHIADAPAIGRNGSAWIGVAEPRREGGLALSVGAR
jgi:gamma-glutamyltranspeptidase/glutathione hydrolase